MGWSRSWPHNTDVVPEGGNACLDGRAAPSVTVGPEDLRVLSTSHEPHKGLLAETGDTSAATAEVARLCSLLHHRYPTFWPETIRALVVDGAQYTSVMLQPKPAEQPPPRSSRPGSSITLSKPSAFDCFITCCDPGTRSASTLAAFFRPFRIFAASRKSSVRALVQPPAVHSCRRSVGVKARADAPPGQPLPPSIAPYQRRGPDNGVCDEQLASKGTHRAMKHSAHLNANRTLLR